MRQKNIREALRKWDGMTLYGLTSRGYQNLPSRLSSILQADVPKSYYLSSRACLGILRRASARGKELPEILRTALERQTARMDAEMREEH